MNNIQPAVSYQVVYTVTVPGDTVDQSKKDVEDCAWDIMETAHIRPTITKIVESVPRTILSPYIVSKVNKGPAYFEGLLSDKFMELLHGGFIDPVNSVFGNYNTLKELITFLIRNPEFCVGGLFYANEKILLTEITCKVKIDDLKMIEYLKFARKADELGTVNGNLRAWYD